MWKGRVIKELIMRKLLGWPKKKGIESNEDEPLKCFRCEQAGHNKKTCHSAMPVRSTLFQNGNTLTRRRIKRIQAQYMYLVYFSMFQRQFTSVLISTLMSLFYYKSLIVSMT